MNTPEKDSTTGKRTIVATDSNDAATVVVTVTGGPQADVPWAEGMTALDVLQAAFTSINPAEQFTFALQYYGPELGYLVIMINETYDSFISKGGALAKPFFYWEFLVNGQPAAAGVSVTRVNAGDRLVFEFEMFNHEKHAGSTLQMKFDHQSRN